VAAVVKTPLTNTPLQNNPLQPNLMIQNQIPQNVYPPQSSPTIGSIVTGGALGQVMQPQVVQQQVIVRAAPPPEPLFVSVPPRPQKLLHSEAYIRYIESLHKEKKSMGEWEKSLRATKETVKPIEEGKLPGHWLANGPGAHGNVSAALWALRDFMMRDSLNLHRSLNR